MRQIEVLRTIVFAEGAGSAPKPPMHCTISTPRSTAWSSTRSQSIRLIDPWVPDGELDA